MMQRCHEVEFGDIHCHEVHTLRGDHTVEEHVGHQHFCGWGGYFAWVVNSVSPYLESHSVGLCHSGLTVQTNCLCVMSFMYSASTLCWKINSIVLAGFYMRPLMLFANRPNLLADERLHVFFVFWAVH
jgi:hypothetical protein